MYRPLVVLILIVSIFLNLVAQSYLFAADNIQERFKGSKKIMYEVYFNGLRVGSFVWEYLGRGKILGKEVYILSANADTNIIGIFSLINKEKVFLEKDSYLPLKVQREVVYFGKKEVIEEVYNQAKGYVTITKRNGKTLEEMIPQDKPIHNILALLYFFPRNITLQEGKTLLFNLPTQKLSIKVVSSQSLSTTDGEKDTYCLIGKGARDFKIWLDKKERLPLRLDSSSLLGKVVILKSK